jgi:hypothetical protein
MMSDVAAAPIAVAKPLPRSKPALKRWWSSPAVTSYALQGEYVARCGPMSGTLTIRPLVPVNTTALLGSTSRKLAAQRSPARLASGVSGLSEGRAGPVPLLGNSRKTECGGIVVFRK